MRTQGITLKTQFNPYVRQARPSNSPAQSAKQNTAFGVKLDFRKVIECIADNPGINPSHKKSLMKKYTEEIKEVAAKTEECFNNALNGIIDTAVGRDWRKQHCKNLTFEKALPEHENMTINISLKPDGDQVKPFAEYGEFSETSFSHIKLESLFSNNEYQFNEAISNLAGKLLSPDHNIYVKNIIGEATEKINAKLIQQIKDYTQNAVIDTRKFTQGQK